MKAARTKEWAEAQRRCRLSDAALAMAKELGMSPKSLTKNIPNRSQPWKTSVEEWVRQLHEKKFGPRSQVAAKSRTAAAPPSPTPKRPPGFFIELATEDDELTRAFATGDFASRTPEPPDYLVNESEEAQQSLFDRLETGEIREESLIEESEGCDRHSQ